MKKKEDRKPIVVVGGHFSPAYALVEGLVKKNIPIIFIGRVNSFTATDSPTLEHKLIAKLPSVTFYPFDSGRFNSRQQYKNLLLQILLFMRALVRASTILHSTRPKSVFVFGGYLAVPVALCAYVLGIDVYLHEQTVSPGKATSFIARFAKKVFTAFPQATNKFRSAKCIGNPYHSDFFSMQKPAWLSPVTNRPLVLVMGGSSGAHQINAIIEKNLDVLTQNFHVVHQTGISEYKDFDRLKNRSSSTYTPVPFILPSEHGYLLSHAKLAITRSGANTFFLLAYYSLPSLLIPLPIASNEEQQLHAKIITQVNAGMLLEDEKLFIKLVREVAQNSEIYKNNFTNLKQYKQLVITSEKLLHEINT